MFQKRFVTKSKNGKQVKIKKVNGSKKIPAGRRRPDIERNGLKVKLKNSSKKIKDDKKNIPNKRGVTKYPDGFMFVDNIKGINRRKERRCIYTVSIGNDLNWLFNITHKFMKEYAKKCNADFVVIDDNWRAYDEHPCMLKQAINSFWYRYDRVLYVDSDILIKTNAPNLFEEVPVGFLGAFDEFSYCGDNLKDVKKKYISQYVKKHNELFTDNKFSLDISDISDGFFNMGVFLCDRYTNPHTPPISNDMRLGISPHYDQVFCNTNIKDKNIPTFVLDKRWNQFRTLIRKDEYLQDAYFVHYVGDTYLKIKEDLDKFGLTDHLTKKNVKDMGKGVLSPKKKPSNVTNINLGTEKRMMCTIIVGDKFRELAKYALPFIQKYAEKCKCDLVIFDESYQSGYEHPILMKTEINKFWDKYSQICYMDLDMLVKEETPDIFNMVPMGTLGCVERGSSWKGKRDLNPETLMTNYLIAYNNHFGEKRYTLSGYNNRYYNAGLFVCDKNTIPYRKEELVLTGFKHEFYEQCLFNLLIHEKKIPVIELPMAFNRSPSENPILGSKDLLSHCWISHYTIGEEALVVDSKRLLKKDYTL